MKTKHSVGIKNLGHQLDHINSKRIQLLQEYGTDPDNSRLFLILIKEREIDMVCDGKKSFEVKVKKLFKIEKFNF